MGSKIVIRTLLLLGTWLVSQNFNVLPANQAPTTSAASASTFVQTGGKSMDSFASETSILQKHLSPQLSGPGYHLKTVVLDAGHGGKDPGCTGVGGTHEKHNALAIILKLGALIEENYPDVNVIYTRKDDVFIELNERAAIANRNHADLFISVHCNAMSVSSAKGTETYVMGLHTAEHNLEVAKRENASILLEEGYQKNYGDYDPNSAEAHILGSVWQSAYLEQSILLAGMVQKHAKSTAKRDDRGVKQAGFLVLRETAMPAILVESGYMTNALEESFLLSEEGRDQLALSVFYGFEDYKRQMEGKKPVSHPEYTPPPAGAAKVVAVKNTEPAKPAKTVPVKNNTAPASATTSTQTHTAAAAVKKPAEPAKIPQPVGHDYTGPVRIFLLSWPQRLDRNTGQLGLLSDVQEEIISGQYHYFLGNFTARNEADRMLSEIKNLGFRTAFLAPSK
jgi:N-acetylmuramoyl-L-alanine amidase